MIHSTERETFQVSPPPPRRPAGEIVRTVPQPSLRYPPPAFRRAHVRAPSRPPLHTALHVVNCCEQLTRSTGEIPTGIHARISASSLIASRSNRPAAIPSSRSRRCEVAKGHASAADSRPRATGTSRRTRFVPCGGASRPDRRRLPRRDHRMLTSASRRATSWRHSRRSSRG